MLSPRKAAHAVAVFVVEHGNDLVALELGAVHPVPPPAAPIAPANGDGAIVEMPLSEQVKLEAEVLGKILVTLSDLSHPSRRRVVAYAIDRFALPGGVVRESIDVEQVNPPGLPAPTG